MKRIKIMASACMLMIFVLLAVSCSKENDSIHNPDSNEAVDIFDLNSITAFLELNKEDITILSEKDDQLAFALTSDEDINVYVTKLEEIGFSLENGRVLDATISSTCILEDGNHTAAITSISDSCLELYKEVHRNDIEGVEKLTEENMLFQFVKGDIVFDSAEHDAGTGAAVDTVYEVVNNLDEVTIEIKEETLSTTGLVLIIRNDSKNECTFGSFYCLEIKVDDIWYQLPYIIEDNVGWNAIAYPIGENDEKEFEVNWEWLYGKLDTGEYRIVKDAFIDNIWETKYYVAAEFAIE